MLCCIKWIDDGLLIFNLGFIFRFDNILLLDWLLKICFFLNWVIVFLDYSIFISFWNLFELVFWFVECNGLWLIMILFVFINLVIFDNMVKDIVGWLVVLSCKVL